MRNGLDFGLVKTQNFDGGEGSGGQGDGALWTVQMPATLSRGCCFGYGWVCRTWLWNITVSAADSATVRLNAPRSDPPNEKARFRRKLPNALRVFPRSTDIGEWF